MKQIVFATNNKHKLEEVRNIVGNTFQILSLNDISCTEEIPETENTIEGNALLKARFIKEKYGYDCFADDTGLEIESLNNEPGVYSARYAGNDHNAEKNMLKVLTKLQGIPNRKARFRTCIALLWNGNTYTFEGIVKGRITEEKQGSAGFGYDPIFQPEGYTHTFAELGDEIKNKISHRAIATQKLIAFLQSSIKDIQ
ncbi:MAG: non-canonical purine NTP diphosphatase [Coprobacter sp.]|nr:non-canonical purine NTP diphosphatase [Coprobacter sp.]